MGRIKVESIVELRERTHVSRARACKYPTSVGSKLCTKLGIFQGKSGILPVCTELGMLQEGTRFGYCCRLDSLENFVLGSSWLHTCLLASCLHTCGYMLTDAWMHVRQNQRPLSRLALEGRRAWLSREHGRR